MTGSPLDLAGIGIGPFNLSLAAQADAVGDLDARFFEREPAFDWHPGMMLPGVSLQTSFLKDLVTATNPTSPWSFMAYLVAQKRFYEFLNADFAEVPRREFARYLAWVAARLPSLRIGTAVREVTFAEDSFVLACDGPRAGGPVRARNLALGVGLRPAVPDFAAKLPEPQWFHASKAAFALDRTAGRRVAVVGGGQSGAEIVLDLLGRGRDAPARVDWISRRPNFLPLDATPFTNEVFTPHYVERFRDLPEPRRRAIVARQKLAGDGISAETLRALYRRLYALRHLEPEGPAVGLLPHRDVRDADATGGVPRLVMRNGFDGGIEVLRTEVVILATGYRYALPDCLAPIRHRLALDADGRPQPSADFAIRWDGPDHCRIFALNAGLTSHGIAEPQLSLMAWRSAVIVNALAGRPCFDLAQGPSPVAWSGPPERAWRVDASCAEE
ncbi:L-lysine 6-monooxygenase (NADPH) [Methylobacterium sp. 4-46]|uniref:lysine N(6)-hydroxylase/L-ornithine N(5)-oxygenase family protein n=1 Tax=unclassified Methylobacterium TaxID=2615210 RepID=UPI000152CF56|nr:MULTISPECIES: SidA/IucD/PvdA family monooxygenase [Methylobacterium]ACA19386.1 L-lysine 6-monooxygenase (NADPH) [Methylobacterium sp. 4-46]WFT78583.1 SidA/IucD/PvdA family monooxygenase [Methylobacterium nodulans]